MTAKGKQKKPQAEKTKPTDDYIRSIGQPLFLVNMLKGIVVILALAVVSLSVMLFTLMGKVSEVKPLPIFVDRDAGTARPVDFSVIDATGNRRSEPEIHDFSRDYIENIYTFTKQTVESNLSRVLDKSSPEAQNQVKNVIFESRRNESLAGGRQGLCDIRSIVVLNDTSTLIRVQVDFIAKEIGNQRDAKREFRKIATVSLKTVLRQRNNAHGLYVVEYRETDVQGAKI